jgi:hypothetical protein
MACNTFFAPPLYIADIMLQLDVHRCQKTLYAGQDLVFLFLYHTALMNVAAQLTVLPWLYANGAGARTGDTDITKLHRAQYKRIFHVKSNPDIYRPED